MYFIIFIFVGLITGVECFLMDLDFTIRLTDMCLK